jgi:uncharacterized protein YecE (DUF72 family)
MRLYVGTSGYSYKEWKGPFYPKELSDRQMLRFYGERFPAVEINNTYYQMPKAKLLANWAAEVPEGFRFAFKAPQRITHQARLKENARQPTAHLFETLGALGDRLGPVLFGLPPNLKKDLPRLEAFLELLPSACRVAFEFRNPTWLDDGVYEALRGRNAALCIADMEEQSTPFEKTADWGYLRLRRAGYGDAELADWARRTSNAGWSEAYVFLKHEDEGKAPEMAARFRDAASST